MVHRLGIPESARFAKEGSLMAAISFRVTLTAAVAAMIAGQAQAQVPQPQYAAPAGIQQANGVQAVARPPVLRPAPQRPTLRFRPARVVPTGVRSVPQQPAAAAGVASTGAAGAASTGAAGAPPTGAAGAPPTRAAGSHVDQWP